MSARIANYSKRDGMTLIEIMIVVIIMAMIATAVGVAVLPAFTKSQIKQAKSDAMAVRSAVEMYLAESPGECPDVKALVEEDFLNKSARSVDPWGTDFEIECEGSDVTVRSAGPDKEWGGEDDIE